MKIVDDKGKLFGLINIIDLAVLLALVAIVAVGISRKGNVITSQNESKKAIITYEFSDLRDISASQFKVGDPIYHYDKGTYIGEIVEVSTKPHIERVDTDGKWVMSEVPERYVLDLKVKADISETDEYYVAGGEQTRVGIQYRVKNKNIAGWGICIGIEEVTE